MGKKKQKTTKQKQKKKNQHFLFSLLFKRII